MSYLPHLIYHSLSSSFDLSSLFLSFLVSLLNRLTQLHLNAKKAREVEKEMKAELEGGVEQLNKMLVRMYG